MDLSTFLGERTNVVEAYIVPRAGKDVDNAPFVRVAWPGRLSITCLGQGHTAEMHVYHYHDMIYTYDRSNDGQRACRRRLEKEQLCSGPRGLQVYALGFEEEVLPNHRFPSSTEMEQKHVIERTTYRIHNRLHLCVDFDTENQETTAYIRYGHHTQVDVRRVQQELDRVLQMLQRVGVFNP